MNKFIHFLQTFSHLSQEAIAAVEQKLNYHSLPKNHELVSDTSKCNSIYFIEQGVARQLYYKESKEITDWFGFEGSVIGPVVRGYQPKNGPYSIQLLENTKLISIHFDDLQALFDRFHEIERVGRILAVHAIVVLQKRLDSIQFETAAERYENLLKEYPAITQRVPLGYIASYLGITQVTLSRIRADH